MLGEVGVGKGMWWMCLWELGRDEWVYMLDGVG